MASVEIVGPLKQFDEALGAIQEAGVLHLEEIPLFEGVGPGALHRIDLGAEQVHEREALEELSAMLAGAVERMPKAEAARLAASDRLAAEQAQWERMGPAAISAAARPILARVRSFMRRERNLGDDLQVLEAYEEVVGSLAPLVERQALPKGSQFLGVIFERQHRGAVDLVRHEFARIAGPGATFLQAELAHGRVAVLLGFPQERAQSIRHFVSDAGIGELGLPRYLADRPFEEALATLDEDLAALRRKRGTLLERVQRFYQERGLSILALHRVTRDRLARFDALPKFARTDYAFVIRGWTMAREVPRLEAKLRARAGAAALRRVRAADMGKPPVLLANPGPVRPFETLLALLPLPEYGSVDPTGLLATFFPPMFGLMLGDIGYGAVLAGVAGVLLVLGKRRKLAARLGVVLGICALFTIGFGFVFGELFGSLGHQIGLRPLWRERFSLGGGDLTVAILGYLLVSVGIGVVQVFLGFILGIVNAIRFGERGQLIGTIARMSGVIALFFLVGWLTKLIPSLVALGGFAFLGAFVALMVMAARHDAVHGIVLPLEVLSAIGNILSYARLMAIGMASVVLALLANFFAGMMGNVFLAILVAVLVHGVNLVLGVVDPTIQGLRLHYVEFFSKFYLSGGKPFVPFRKSGGALA